MATETPTALSTRPPDDDRRAGELTFRELLRWTWRQVTSMRTALVLLLLLALAAIPGSIIPQEGVDSLKTSNWQTAHPKLTPVYEKLGLFSVYDSPWFSAIYILLMLSLVGCIVPRTFHYWRGLRAKPPAAPRNLTRLPEHATYTTSDAPDVVVERARVALRSRRYRLLVDDSPDGGAVSAERGYLREAGNLVFHLSVLVVLVGFALGSMFGYKGGVILLVGDQYGFSNNLTQYDDFDPGSLFRASDMEPFSFTIDDFDVDWLTGMSVGVFPIQSGKAQDVAADLEKVFGEKSQTPSAGMFRFMPLENANAVLVITPQARYLDQIQQWLDRIDSAGGAPRLFSYELKYIKARELADRLAEVFGAGSRGGSDNVPLAPGATSMQLGSSGASGNGLTGEAYNNVYNRGSGGSDAGTDNGIGSGGEFNLAPRQSGNGSVTLEVEGDRVGVSAVEETNTLLVRSSPQAWHSIREVIDKLDTMPMQVHIEAQVAEVKLTGKLSYGVNWYFEQAVNADPANGGAGLPSALGRGIWGDISGSITDGGLGWTFLGKNAAAVISALDQVTDVRLLQTPSVFVRNNAEASLNVGTKVPINSVSVNTGLGSDSTFSQVQYLDTGVILKVRPRVTREGTVFLDIVQEVSSAGAIPAGCDPAKSTCNPPIDTRRVHTEAAVNSGDTIMLAGLISDRNENGSSGVPFLSRLPVVGALFGKKTQNEDRQEVIVLITPTIVKDAGEARRFNDEYGRKFKALEPLYTPARQ